MQYVVDERTGLRFDLTSPVSIAIPLEFGGEQPNAFYLPRAEAEVAEGGEFIGDTRRGGSCNCETVRLNPHGNGTHTECVGHLSTNRISVSDVLTDVFIPSLLVTLPLREDGTGGRAIMADDLRDRLRAAGEYEGMIEGLIIRTFSDEDHLIEWSGNNPPYFSAEGIGEIRRHGIRHLLTDLPSLDREDDPDLTAHRIFWDLPPSGPIEGSAEEGRTITEMIDVPAELEDGIYLLTIQIPPFLLDAAPSRPLLYPRSGSVPSMN